MEFNTQTKAMCVKEQGAKFSLMEFQRRPVGDRDVAFDIQYCGICHSDVHIAKNDLNVTNYPCVPGHELAGIVRQVGSQVTKFKVGDEVGVGCFVDACLECQQCLDGDEQYCSKGGITQTYNSKAIHGRAGDMDSDHTLGGYTNKHVVDERFVIKVPQGYGLEKAGPIFCAGITLYDPLKHWGATKGGFKIGVAGLGGLGQMGVKLAVAMGNTVTVISTSPNKQQMALDMGAENFVVISDNDSVQKQLGSLDFILNTVSADHQLVTYLPLLKTNGTIIQFGLVTAEHIFNQVPLILGRLTISGSLIGGIKNTQECIDFCNEKKIYVDTKLVSIDDLDQVYENLTQGNDQGIRYVLDTSTFEPVQQSSFTTDCKAFITKGPNQQFEVVDYKRKDVEDYDIGFDVDFCGVCHSDKHVADNYWQGTKYPCCPGHELAGTVQTVGKKVTKFKIGDKIGVGCFVDSCLECENCLIGDENYCKSKFTSTYNSEPKHGRAGNPDQIPHTYGGYSTKFVVHEKFAIQIPKNYPLEFAGPVFCSGITMYDPLKHWGATKGGLKVGIAGFGGLGVMGVKLAIALGNEVTVISTTASKEQTAKQMGANFLLINDQDQVKQYAKSFDIILNTVSAAHELHQYLSLIAQDGVLVCLGVVMEAYKLNQLPLLFSRIKIAGSLIGGIKNTQECIDLCAKNKIFPEIKVVPANVTELENIYAILRGKNELAIRYVIDFKNNQQ